MLSEMPLAQWIERCPPEADAGARIAAVVQLEQSAPLD